MKQVYNTLLILLLLSPFYVIQISLAQTIQIDEDFSDWDDIPTFYQDATGDNLGTSVDFKTLKITNDDRYLYLYLEVGAEINIQQDNSISLLIDLDRNSETGESYLGIGYELIFNFGQRNGQYYNPNENSFNSYDIGLFVAPTVTSTVFELKINRNAELEDDQLFNEQSFDFLIRSASSNGDLLPDNGSSTLSYTFNNELIFGAEPYSLKKNDPSDLRVLTYNVERDNLFNASAKDNFRRIFQAIEPDIIGLEEVYNNSGQQAAALIEEFLPSKQNQQWYSGDTGTDNLIVSRFPVLKQTSIAGNSAYLLDLGDRELLTVVAHPPCCTNNESRQLEIDEFMAFIRDSKSGSEFDIKENTPIIIMGDMNLVGFSQQYTTMVTGDIVNEDSFGADFNPDWDETPLEDLKPTNPGLPTTFTWYSASSSFGAGRLDYIVYSGSVLEAKNSFSLFTPEMNSDSLAAYGLERNDVILASDHLPVVGDFVLKTLTSSEIDSENPQDFELYQNYPNPFNPSTVISFQLEKHSNVKVVVFDALGRTIETLFDGNKSIGKHSITFDAKSLPSGLYYYSLSADGFQSIQKMILLK
ncbi:MAG: endonuclease/exonuclease/phosphatase family protein [Balneolaceae bacterium]